MKRMRCPLNGVRNISEFRYGGEAVPHPDASACTDAQWADFVFMPENPAGLVREWWCHVASSYWFIAERNNVRDEIERTYPVEDLQEDIWVDQGGGSQGDGSQGVPRK